MVRGEVRVRQVIAICGEVCSSNLGDGVIADCLSFLLEKAGDGSEVVLVDFAAREEIDFGSSDVAKKNGWIRRTHMRWCRNRFYSQVTALLLWHLRKRRRLTEYWRGRLKDASLVVIGGGQLLMDNGLTFPLKVRELVRIASSEGKAVAICACGVGQRWSWLGRRIVFDALNHECVTSVSTRDGGARELLRVEVMKRDVACEVTFDPALWAGDAYGVKRNPQSGVIGLGIAEPEAMRPHATNASRSISREQFVCFWRNLACQLVKRQRRVAFFTNGSPRDHLFAQEILAGLKVGTDMACGDVSKIDLLERPRTPKGLVSLVADFQGIVAHRLHANIVAYSLGIPAVGLVWDQKVREFGKLTGRSRFHLDPSQMEASSVADLLEAAIDAGVDEERLASCKANVLTGLCEMLNRAEAVS